jgi:hypothetical protein
MLNIWKSVNRKIIIIYESILIIFKELENFQLLYEY